MSQYDVIIVGGATSGCYLARQLASKGIKVKVIESCSEGKAGRFDIVHIRKADFKTFNLPEVHEGDGIYAFGFSENSISSPYNDVHVPTPDPIVGVHFPLFISRMTEWAKEAGAEFEFDASFDSVIFKENKIAGIKYKKDGEIKEDYCKLLIDATGMKCAVRKQLPATYGIETTTLGPNDMFYVVLYYLRMPNPDVKNTGWANYKTWIAPASSDPYEKIFGIGACNSFEYAKERYKYFEENCPNLPKGTLIKEEVGTTPYTRPPYTMVADNFVATGDAANLTKPLNGEGITSSMVQMDVAAKVIEKALKKGSCLKEDLWEINTEYNKGQGADFVFLRALMTKLVKAKDSEFEYFFRKLQKLLGKLMGDPDAEVKLTLGDIMGAAGALLGGLFTGKVSFKTLNAALDGLSKGNKLKKLYVNFPKNPAKFDKWCSKADKAWNKVGKMT